MCNVSEFKEKSDLIDELLHKVGLDFEPDMTEEEHEKLDVERQMFVLRAGWNNMFVPELKVLLMPKPVVEEVKRKKEIHPIFQYLVELMKEKRIYCCLSSDGKANIHIYSYFDPCPADGDPEKYVPWIYVSVDSYGDRIEKLEEQFNFNYPKDKKWFVQQNGQICVKSILSCVFQTFRERDKSTYEADNTDSFWLVTQLDALLELLKNAKRYHPYNDKIQWSPSN